MANTDPPTYPAARAALTAKRAAFQMAVSADRHPRNLPRLLESRATMAGALTDWQGYTPTALAACVIAERAVRRLGVWPRDPEHHAAWQMGEALAVARGSYRPTF